ncbi:hypothetical protein F-liban_75 [Faustovirus]|nr:hypothetical protein F-liban_75 [Faustovirus]SME64749.1 Hypothetical protein FSTVST1_74 [Faustovirus ST1]
MTSTNAAEYIEIPLDIVIRIISFGSPILKGKFNQTCKWFNQMLDISTKTVRINKHGTYMSFYDPEWRWYLDLDDFIIYTRMKTAGAYASLGNNIINVLIKSTGECLIRNLHYDICMGKWISHDGRISYDTINDSLFEINPKTTFRFNIMALKGKCCLEVSLDIETKYIVAVKVL